MARMERCEFRIPAELKARAEAEAKEQGLDLSEFIRHAILARLVWSSAIRAAEGGQLGFLSVQEFREAVERLGAEEGPDDEKPPP